MRPLAHPIAPVVGAALAALAYLLIQPATADMAAHAFRAWLFDTEGMTVWNAQWYGGHHVLGYSMLFAPLAAWPGPAWVGALAAVAATAAFVPLAREAAPSPGAATAAHVAVRRRCAQQRGHRPDAVHARHRARGGGLAVRGAAHGRLARAGRRAGARLRAGQPCRRRLPGAGSGGAGGRQRPRGARARGDAGAAGGRRRRDDGGAVPGGRRRPLRGHRLLADAGGRRWSARRCWRPAGERCGPA